MNFNKTIRNYFKLLLRSLRTVWVSFKYQDKLKEKNNNLWHFWIQKNDKNFMIIFEYLDTYTTSRYHSVDSKNDWFNKIHTANFVVFVVRWGFSIYNLNLFHQPFVTSNALKYNYWIFNILSIFWIILLTSELQNMEAACFICFRLVAIKHKNFMLKGLVFLMCFIVFSISKK